MYSTTFSLCFVNTLFIALFITVRNSKTMPALGLMYLYAILLFSTLFCSILFPLFYVNKLFEAQAKKAISPCSQK